MKTSFESLPADLQETILAVSAGAPKKGYHAFSLEGIGWKVFLAIAGGGALALGLWNALQGWPSWSHFSTWMPWIGGGFFACALGTIAAIDLQRSRLRPNLIVTPGLAIKLGRAHEAVHLVRLDQVTDVSILLKTVTILRGKDRVVVDLADQSTAQRFSKLAAERCMAEDDERTRDHRLLKKLDAAGPRDPGARGVRPAFLAAALTAVAAPVLIFATWAVRANVVEADAWRGASGPEPARAALERYRREAERAEHGMPSFIYGITSFAAHAREAHAKLDDATYAEAIKAGPVALREYKKAYPDGKHAREVDEAIADADAKLDDETFADAREKGGDALRLYKEKFPRGRHAAEVDAAIEESFARIKRDWVARARTFGRSPQLIACMEWLFDHVRENPAPRIPIVLEPVRGAREATPPTARDRFGGVVSIHPLGPTFDRGAHAAREQTFVDRLRQDLGGTLRSSKLALVPVERPPRSGAWLSVATNVEGTGKYARYSRNAFGGAGTGFVEFTVELTLTLHVPGASFEASGSGTASPPGSIRNEWEDVYGPMATTSYGRAGDAVRKAFAVH